MMYADIRLKSNNDILIDNGDIVVDSAPISIRNKVTRVLLSSYIINKFIGEVSSKNLINTMEFEITKLLMNEVSETVITVKCVPIDISVYRIYINMLETDTLVLNIDMTTTSISIIGDDIDDYIDDDITAMDEFDTSISYLQKIYDRGSNVINGK